MKNPQSGSNPSPEKNSPLALWKAILLIIILVFGLVALFGVLIYLFIRGVQQMGLPTIANIVIFVIISGIFAWLIKRLTDIFSGFSQVWFPEEDEAIMIEYHGFTYEVLETEDKIISRVRVTKLENDHSDSSGE